MTLHPRPAVPPSLRLRAILQAILFIATIVSSPFTHEWTCDGPCARTTLEAGAAGAAGDAATPPCHRAGHGDGKRHGCQCTDDCCSVWAHFVAPPELDHRAGPTLLVTTPVPSVPEPTPRASGVRLLPYPTGPPSAS